MAGVIDRLVYEVGYDVDKTSFDDAKKGLGEIGKGFLNLSKLAIGASTALFGFTALVTSEEAEIQRLANAMGVAGDTVDAFGNEMKKIGGNSENFLDLIEETNNKIGEMKGLGEFNTLEESLGILGLKFKDIKDLSPEEQFREIANASLEMKDSQEAVTAVDMLMSGEANKLIASLRAQGLTYDDVIQKQKELTFQTEESRANSLKFANSLNTLMRVISSLTKFVAGELGSVFEDIVKTFTDWAVANKEVISSGIKEFVKTLSALFSGLWTVLRTLGNILAWVIDKFGGLNATFRLLIGAGIAFGLFKVAQGIALIGIMAKKSGGWIKFMSKALRTMRNLLLIGALIAIFEDLYNWIVGNDSVMGKLVGTFDVWWVQFKDGISVIGDLLSWLGNMILETLLMPFNLVIDQLNNIISLANSAGSFLGLDTKFETINKVTPESLGALGSQAISSIGDTVSSTANNAFNVVVNASGDATQIAQAVGVEMENLAQKAIIASQSKQK